MKIQREAKIGVEHVVSVLPSEWVAGLCRLIIGLLYTLHRNTAASPQLPSAGKHKER